MSSIAAAIGRLRAYVDANDLAPSRFAQLAGLSPNALRGFERDDWNPTVETLRKLEAVIPAGFQVAGDTTKKGRAA